MPVEKYTLRNINNPIDNNKKVPKRSHSKGSQRYLFITNTPTTRNRICLKCVRKPKLALSQRETQIITLRFLICNNPYLVSSIK